MSATTPTNTGTDATIVDGATTTTEQKTPERPKFTKNDYIAHLKTLLARTTDDVDKREGQIRRQGDRLATQGGEIAAMRQEIRDLEDLLKGANDRLTRQGGERAKEAKKQADTIRGLNLQRSQYADILKETTKALKEANEKINEQEAEIATLNEDNEPLENRKRKRTDANAPTLPAAQRARHCWENTYWEY